MRIRKIIYKSRINHNLMKLLAVSHLEGNNKKFLVESSIHKYKIYDDYYCIDAEVIGCLEQKENH